MLTLNMIAGFLGVMFFFLIFFYGLIRAFVLRAGDRRENSN